jgi:tRNA threonylcarbamoyladenosine biosynthesis protein TsaB
LLILAIDSATPTAGVALLNENGLLREEFVNYKKTHSETLMPMVHQILSNCDCRLADVSALAVTVGPGSFTGLRIGLAAVKGLSLASGIPVVAVSTLDVLAHNFSYNEALVCPLLDARKQEVYTAFYDTSAFYPLRLSDETACTPAEFIQQAKATAAACHKEDFILLGDGFRPYQEYFKQELGSNLYQAPTHLMLPRAAALASLAARKLQRAEIEDVYTLQPHYVRLSEAEYKLNRGELNKC